MDDIDALKLELQETRLAYQAAIALARWKGGFLGRGAHELRSPLSSLLSLHQLILADLCEDAEEEREFVAQAHQAANKLMAMLDEIIAVSKLESGNITVDIQPLSLEQLFQNVERLTRVPAANRNIPVQFLPSPPSLFVLADERRLAHALVLLIDTAIAHADRGTIRVAGDCPNDDTVTISLDLPCPVSLWQETEPPPIPPVEANREAIERLSQSLSLSPSLQFDLVRAIIATLHGEIHLGEIPGQAGEVGITRIDCSLPRSGDEELTP